MYQRQISFGEAISRALGKNYCNFSGRASRSEFWWFQLFGILLSAVIFPLVASDSTFGHIIYYLVCFALVLPSLGLTVRRLHDIGKSGWWIFISLIPLIGAIILLYWECLESQSDNEYGPVPNMVF